jgi:RNA polymerase sigma-70 factor (ECF subfamily)
MSDDAQRGDVELLREIASSPEGLEAFYRRHVDGVTHFLARRCRTPEDLADAVSATFVAVLVSAQSYNPDLGSPTAWLYAIARNEARGQGRSLGRREALRHRLEGSTLLSRDDTDRLAELIDAESRVVQLEETLNGASVGELELLHSMVARDVSVTEASLSLGISSATGRKRLERLRRRLPDDFKPQVRSDLSQPIPMEEK